jgi:hypothetical protein
VIRITYLDIYISITILDLPDCVTMGTPLLSRSAFGPRRSFNLLSIIVEELKEPCNTK